MREASNTCVRYCSAWTERDRDGEHLFAQLELCDDTLASMQEQAITLAQTAGEPEDVGAQRKADDARFGERKIARVLRQMAAALACAHARNVAHLDVKPDNILVKNSCTSSATGAARGARGASVTRVSVQTESLAVDRRRCQWRIADARYLAPELLRGEVQVGGPSIHPGVGGSGRARAPAARSGSGDGPDSPTVDDRCAAAPGPSGRRAIPGSIEPTRPPRRTDRPDRAIFMVDPHSRRRGARPRRDEVPVARQGKYPR